MTDFFTGRLELPEYAGVFFLAALGVLTAAILVRMLGRARAAGPGAREKRAALESSLREAFGDVEVVTLPFGLTRLRVRPPTPKEGEPPLAWTLRLPRPTRLEVESEEPLPGLPCLIVAPAGPGWLNWLRFWLPRPITTGDRLADATFRVHPSPSLRPLAFELVQSGTLVEPLVVMRRLPGVRQLEIETGASGCRAILELAGDELLYRPERLESLLTNLEKVYRAVSAA